MQSRGGWGFDKTYPPKSSTAVTKPALSFFSPFRRRKILEGWFWVGERKPIFSYSCLMVRVRRHVNVWRMRDGWNSNSKSFVKNLFFSDQTNFFANVLFLFQFSQIHVLISITISIVATVPTANQDINKTLHSPTPFRSTIRLWLHKRLLPWLPRCFHEAMKPGGRISPKARRRRDIRKRLLFKRRRGENVLLGSTVYWSEGREGKSHKMNSNNGPSFMSSES